MNVLKKKKDKKKSSEFNGSVASSNYPPLLRYTASNAHYPSRGRVGRRNRYYEPSNCHYGLSNESYLLNDRLSNNISYLDEYDIEAEDDEYYINKNKIKYYQKSVNMCDAGGVFNIGNCHEYGVGVKKDLHKAFEYYKESARMGDTRGMCNVGYYYRRGIGVEKNEQEAFIYYQMSASMGDANGIYNVGFCYEYGIGVEQDDLKAFKYYQTAADIGHDSGTYNVGHCYRYGIGSEVDEYQAFKYFEKSADMGNAAGMLSVAQCYRNGIGIERDLNQANYWYSRARSMITVDKRSFVNLENYQLPWISYNEFEDIEEIGQGGFATVYYARWFDKSRNLHIPVALKILDSNNYKEFIEELKAYYEIGNANPSFLKCYGTSKNDSGKHILVLEYARMKSLSKNLYAVSQMNWKKKLKLLHCITSDLEAIHSQGYIHRDLHSGNILQDGIDNAYIADLGLSSSMKNENEKLYGVLPYIAPEVLLGKGFTQSADIYSLGIIMTEISTGQKAFDDYQFDEEFAVKVCCGLRPKLASVTPNCYVELAKQCMDLNPDNRPTAINILNKIDKWNKGFDDLDENDIKKQFVDADSVKPNPEPQKHPNYIYTSKDINTKKIIIGSKKISTEIPNRFGWSKSRQTKSRQVIIPTKKSRQSKIPMIKKSFP